MLSHRPLRFALMIAGASLSACVEVTPPATPTPPSIDARVRAFNETAAQTLPNTLNATCETPAYERFDLYTKSGGMRSNGAARAHHKRQLGIQTSALTCLDRKLPALIDKRAADVAYLDALRPALVAAAPSLAISPLPDLEAELASVNATVQEVARNVDGAERAVGLYDRARKVDWASWGRAASAAVASYQAEYGTGLPPSAAERAGLPALRTGNRAADAQAAAAAGWSASSAYVQDTTAAAIAQGRAASSGLTMTASYAPCRVKTGTDAKGYATYETARPSDRSACVSEQTVLDDKSTVDARHQAVSMAEAEARAEASRARVAARLAARRAECPTLSCR